MKYFTIFFIIFLIVFSFPVSGTTVVYDNITTSQYKIIKIDDVTNWKYINEYPYVVYINGNFYGTFTKDQEIKIPDGSDVVIYVPSPVKSNFADSYDLGKSIVGMGFFLFLGVGILAMAIYVVFKKVTKRR